MPDNRVIHGDMLGQRICFFSFSDPCPAAARGVLLHTASSNIYQGYEWDFYARFDHWCFALSRTPEVSPDATMFDIDPSSIPEGIYIKEGNFGDAGGFDAGYMSVDDLMRIVRECITEFEREYPQRQSSK